MAIGAGALGVSWKVDPENPRQIKGLRNIMVVSGILLAIGITLCVLHGHKTINVPEPIRDAVLIPLDSLATTVFTMTLLGYVVAKTNQPPPKPRLQLPETSIYDSQFFIDVEPDEPQES